MLAVLCPAGSTPVTVLVCRMGLRVDSSKLQERLHFLRGMMGVENAIFFTFEGAFAGQLWPGLCCHTVQLEQLPD